MRKVLRISSGIVACAICIAGCSSNSAPVARAPSIAPLTQPSASLRVSDTPMAPMYHELLAVDLPTVARIAAAWNLDIEQAKQRVLAQHGRYEASVGAIVPVITPSFTAQHLEGVNQAVNGTLVPVNFNTYLPAIALQWVLNPGAVVYDVIASKKRLAASEKQEQSVVLETTRLAAIQYYDLVLAQAGVATARQAVANAAELLRITSLRVKTGAGLRADELRASAALEARQQDLAAAMNEFYQNSVTLTLTLHLDPVVTLVPKSSDIAQTTLVRQDWTIDQLLATAVEWRPDLQAARTLYAASRADTKGTTWAGIGPQVQGGYQFGGVAAHTSNNGGFGLDQQQRAYASVGTSLSASTFGRVKTAKAIERQAEIDALRQLDQVRAQVVRASQDSATNQKVIPAAQRQMESAEEALRLAQANLEAGTLLTLDVLQADDAVSDARLRYVTGVVRYNQSQVNLAAAIGLLQIGAAGK
jgi:outer membrane protein TolC